MYLKPNNYFFPKPTLKNEKREIINGKESHLVGDKVWEFGNLLTSKPFKISGKIRKGLFKRAKSEELVFSQTGQSPPAKKNIKALSCPPLAQSASSPLEQLTEKLKRVPAGKNAPARPSIYAKRYPLETYHRSNQDTCLIDKPAVKEGDWVQNGDLLADSASSVGGELAIGHNIVVAYMPWEGYNYEDAILINQRLVYEDIYTSIHIERYEVQTKDTKLGPEQITREIPDLSQNEIRHLDKHGIAKLGSWVEEGDILVGKVTPFNIKSYTPNEKFLFELFDKKPSPTKDSSLRAPKGIQAYVINVNILDKQKIAINQTDNSKTKTSKTNKKDKSMSLTKTDRVGLKNKKYKYIVKNIHIYLAEKRKIQVGDKMAGRHGNKGIVSRILPRQDMPFLPDGTPVDIVLNPLGVPSRMNVGQIYECLLGLAGRYLGEHYKIPPFDELYGADASRSFVFSKLYEARKKTKLEWLFDPNSPGKMRLFDGRDSECFDQTVTVGMAYILKLVHMVDDKMHSRGTGPYSLVTQQPLRGRSKQGGQRLGEMEVWAIEGYGAAFVLSEMLTIKSDNMVGRQTLWVNLINHNQISLGTPESFKVLVCELQALCLDIGLFVNNTQSDLFTKNAINAHSLPQSNLHSESSSGILHRDNFLRGQGLDVSPQGDRRGFNNRSVPFSEGEKKKSENLILIDSLLHLP